MYRSKLIVFLILVVGFCHSAPTLNDGFEDMVKDTNGDGVANFGESLQVHPWANATLPSEVQATGNLTIDDEDDDSVQQEMATMTPKTVPEYITPTPAPKDKKNILATDGNSTASPAPVSSNQAESIPVEPTIVPAFSSITPTKVIVTESTPAITTTIPSTTTLSEEEQKKKMSSDEMKDRSGLLNDSPAPSNTTDANNKTADNEKSTNGASSFDLLGAVTLVAMIVSLRCLI